MGRNSGLRSAYATPTKSPGSASKAKHCLTPLKLQGSAESIGTSDPTPVQQLRRCLSLKYATGLISGTDLAELAHHLVQCGLEELKDLALDPEGLSFSANANRKVREALDMVTLDSQLVFMDVPCASRDQRHQLAHPFRPLSNLLFAEFLKSPEQHIRDAEALDTKNWLESAVRLDALEKGDICIPYGIFVDAATWKGKGPGTRDSVVNYMASFLGTYARHTCTTISKHSFCSEACGCACRGRCTMMSVDRCIAWLAKWASDGVVPAKDPCGRAWPGTQLYLPNAPLHHNGRKVRFAMIEVRGDLDQFSSGMGMPKTNQAFPCMLCRCRIGQLYQFPAPCPAMIHDDFEARLAEHHVVVFLDASAAAEVINALAMDWRLQGHHGVTLMTNLALVDARSGQVVELRKRDRLEIGGAVQDPHLTDVRELVGQPPFEMHLWRAATSDSLSFRSPLWDVPGMRIEYLMVDDLHTLDLGTCSALVGHSLTAAVRSGALGNITSEQGVKHGCALLSLKLQRWYSIHKVKTRLSRLTPKNLGCSETSYTGRLHSKGGESRALLPFAIRILRLRRVREALGKNGTRLRRAMLHLSRAYELMREATRRTDIEPEALRKLLLQVAVQSKKAGVHLIPKYHIMQHFHEVASRAGSPAFFSAYRDESHNRGIVQLAQSCYNVDLLAQRVLTKEMLQERWL